MLLYSFSSYWPHLAADFYAFHPVGGGDWHHSSSRKPALPGTIVYQRWNSIHCELAPALLCTELVFQSHSLPNLKRKKIQASWSSQNLTLSRKLYGNPMQNGFNQNYRADLQNTSLTKNTSCAPDSWNSNYISPSGQFLFRSF